MRQLVDDRIDQGAEVGLGVQIASEADECLAIVEPLRVEDAIKVVVTNRQANEIASAAAE